jgi:hypothetical protein
LRTRGIGSVSATLEFAGQRVATDPQPTRRFALISLAGVEHRVDVGALEVGERELGITDTGTASELA